MIKFQGLGHINVVVDDINAASQFYQTIFNAIPQQEFTRFKNIGFAKSAGFLENPDKVDVSIRFLEIPGANLFLELMEYHSPRGNNPIKTKLTYDLGGPRHICLKVSNIDEAFNYLKKQDGVTMINTSNEYKPYKIDPIKSSDFIFFDSNKEKDEAAKQQVCDIVGQIRYFYFIDQYGIQWELEQGHDDIGHEH